MIQVVEAIPLTSMISPWYRTPAIEAFPASLSVVRLAGLGNCLNTQTITQLQDMEDLLQKNAPITPILQARTEKSLGEAFRHAYEASVDYYIESGILIWRSLNHDYKKLLRLSQVSSTIIESLFFQHVRRLERDTFIKAMVGLRVMQNVGERIISAEEMTPPDKQAPPLAYLNQVVYASFIMRCFLAYLQGDVNKARRPNLKILAQGVFSGANDVYREALQRNLYPTEAEAAFWNPIWQEGELEADLDKHSGAVKSFNSIEDLIKDLHV